MIGRPRLHLQLTDSTNERARALAEGGAPHGTLVTAGEQTAGRGRQGRSWTSPPGSAVLMSVVLRDPPDLLPLAAAVAVCEACAPLPCTIKWPNDLWIDRRKVAGILVEGRPQAGWAVLGIGLNVTMTDLPSEIRETATSLALHGSARGVENVLEGLVTALDRWLGATSDRVLGAWRERDALRGEPVAWDGGQGTAAGVDDTGALLVDTRAGQITLDAGEIHLRRG